MHGYRDSAEFDSGKFPANREFSDKLAIYQPTALSEFV